MPRIELPSARVTAARADFGKGAIVIQLQVNLSEEMLEHRYELGNLVESEERVKVVIQSLQLPLKMDPPPEPEADAESVAEADATAEETGEPAGDEDLVTSPTLNGFVLLVQQNAAPERLALGDGNVVEGTFTEQDEERFESEGPTEELAF